MRTFSFRPFRQVAVIALIAIACPLGGLRLHAVVPDPVLVRSFGTNDAQGRPVGIYYVASLSSLRKVGPWSVQSRTLPPLTRNAALAIAVAYYRQVTSYKGRFESLESEMFWFNNESTPTDICQYAYEFDLTESTPGHPSQTIIVTMDGLVAEKLYDAEYNMIKR